MINIAVNKNFEERGGDFYVNFKLTINHGELVTIFGGSGVGKTTLLRIIAGLITPDSGSLEACSEIWFDDVKKINVKPQKRNVGFVFQDFALFPHLSVRDNLLFALPKGDEATIISSLIEIMELGHIQNRKPETLSGGQKQRVALARALVQKPQILLLDEPLSSLDGHMRLKLQNYLLEVHKRFNLTTIMVSHDVAETIKMSDRVVVVKDGKVAKQGAAIDVFSEHYANKKSKVLGSILKIDKASNLVSVLLGTQVVQIEVSKEKLVGLQVGGELKLDVQSAN
jgi:molybdate transport system ATP-binding protein